MTFPVRPSLLHPLAVLGWLACLWLAGASEPQFQSSYDLALDPASGDTSPALRVYGRQANDRLGRVVRTGDLNGDGLADLIIGSADAGADAGRASAGRVWIWFGGEGLLGNRDAAGLAGSPPDVTVLGAEASDFLTAGGAVAVADVNGDGISDLLLGAYGADGPGNSRNEAGEAYIIFGRETFPSTIDLASTGDGGADVTILGASASDSLTSGGAITAADVNGDGLTDLLLGAFLGDGPGEGRSDAGEVYVIYGREQFPAVLDLAQQGVEGASVTVHGAHAGERLSYDGTIRIGDVNADGIPDLLLGATPADGPGGQRPSAGRVYVVFGRPGLPPALDLQVQGSNGASLTIYGASENDLIASGAALLAADVNGDGIDDLLIGTPGGDGPNDTRPGAGEVYIVFGRPFFGPEIDLAIRGEDGADVTIYGATAGDNLSAGGALAAGDVNKDGLADLLLGAGLADGPNDARNEAGEAYIIYGRATFPTVLDLATQGAGGADVTLYGASINDNLALGGSLGLADLDRDGRSDLLLGAFNADGPAEGRSNAGEVYVIFGRADLPLTLDLGTPGIADVTVYGASPGDQITTERALIAGDINGDAVPDLIIGTQTGDGPAETRSNAGEVSVVLGIGVPIIGPEIDVQQPVGTPLADGGGRYFGAVLLNNIGTRTFTVLNNGTEDLTGLAVAISGADADDFQADRTHLPAVLPPGESGTFTITFQPTTLGAHLAQLQILSDDEDESPYDIRLTGIGAAPELVIEQPAGTPLASGFASNYGEVATGYAKTLHFTLKNIGTADLDGLAASLAGSEAADYSFPPLPSDTLPPGQSMPLAITFAPGDFGARNGELRVLSSMSPDVPYLIHLNGTGVPPAPEIALRQPAATELQSGEARSFGNVSLGAGSSLSFRLDNTGTAMLSGLTLTTNGDHAGDFAPSAANLPDLAPGASATFTVTFTPHARGPRTTELHIASNDADENPFVVSLAGTGVNPEIVVEQVAQPANLAMASGGSRTFAATPMGSQSSFQFLVKNTGDDTLTGLALSQTGPHTNDFLIVTAGFAASLPPGQSTSFSVIFAPLAAGTRSTTLRLASNDADENPYLIHFSGLGTAPVITVEEPVGSALAYNATVTFDPVLTEATGTARSFTVRNTGGAPLAGLQVAFTQTSPHRSEFVLVPPAVTSLQPGASTTFSVAFSPDFAGSKSATVRLTSPSGGANIMQVNLAALGLPLQPLYGQALASRLAIASTELRLDPLITGADPKTYRWRKNGKELKTPTADLLFKSLKTSDAGIYQQTVTNTYSSATSNNLWLAVAAKPPAAAAVKLNGNLTLACKVTLPPGASATYQWLHEGGPVAAGQGVSGATTKTLKITGIQAERAGAYTCRITVTTPDGSFQGTQGDTTVTVVERAPELQPFSFDDAWVSQDVSGLQIPCIHNPAKFAAAGLPPGVRIDPVTGTLTGKPTAARYVKGQLAPYQVKITVSNLAGKVVSPTLPWTIRPLPEGTAGFYSGVLGRSTPLNGDLGGSFQLTVASTGAFSGKLSLGAGSFAFKGSLNVPEDGGNPRLSLLIPRKAPLPPLHVTDAELDLATGSLTGALEDGGASPAASLDAWRRALQTSALAGTCNAALTPPDHVFNDATTFPQGEGYAVFKTTAKATGTWTGRLADGSTFTHAAHLGEDGRASLFALQQKNTGSLLGICRLNPDNRQLDSLALDWFIQTPQPIRSTGSYRQGIPRHALILAGGPYTAPSPGATEIDLAGGGLAADFTQAFDITSALKILVPTNPHQLAIPSFQPATGLFSGSFIHQGRKALLHGLLVPRLQLGCGHFLLPGEPAPGQKPAAAPAWSGALRLPLPP
jgi:hypothetical protein